MPVDSFIKDGSGHGHKVRITHTGELVTVRGEYDSATAAVMSATATAYNLAVPKDENSFIITGIIVNADKNVSATNGADIRIYEANTDTSISETKLLFTLNLLKNDSEVITGILIKTTEGRYINSDTDDATVNITLLGYYLKNDESE